MDRSDLIDALDEIIYVSDPDTYELLFANRHCQQLMATTDYLGKTCYQVLQGKDAPCEFCTNAQLCEEKFFTWEHTNQMMRKHFLLKDKLIVWKGRPARLEIALDITLRENLSQDVQQKLQTEQTLVECVRALTVAENLDSAMQAVLSGLADFYRADRAYILELDPSIGIASNTFEWCAPGIEPQRAVLQNLDVTLLPFWYQAMRSRTLVTVDDVETLRDRFPLEYGRMHRQGIHHLIAAPFGLHEETIGYLGMDNPSDTMQDLSLLESLSYFVCNELFKRR
ncbi:MAG: GAF domain-containing protein, partial [Oscillospiraceae bacterium]